MSKLYALRFTKENMKAEKVATLYGSNVNTSMRTRESFVIKSQFRNDEVSPYSVLVLGLKENGCHKHSCGWSFSHEDFGKRHCWLTVQEK